MRYQAKITLLNLETQATRSFERTIELSRERSSVHPHDPLPIDVDQKRRALKLAIDEAAADALKDYPV